MLIFLDTVVVRDQSGLHKMQDTKPEILVKKKSGIFEYKLSSNLTLLEKSIFKIALTGTKFQGLLIHLFTINSTAYFLPNSLSFILPFLPAFLWQVFQT